MKHTITRKQLHDIFTVLEDEFKSSINLHQYEIYGALLALAKTRDLIKGTMENGRSKMLFIRDLKNFINDKCDGLRSSKKFVFSKQDPFEGGCEDKTIISIQSKLQAYHSMYEFIKKWEPENEH